MSNQTQTLNNNSKKESNFANAPVSKKIGFFSAMLVVVGSSIGAGIFFKAGSVLDASQGSIVFAMFCWLLAGFAVIAMALALIEIASARNDNLSIIGWCQTFNSRFTYKACKNFMVYIYLPLTYFFMPLYTIMSIQDGISAIVPNYKGFGTNADWAIMMVLVIVISSYFIIVNGISSKIGNIQNWIITSVKFLPLVFAVLVGFIIVGLQGKIAGDYDAGFKSESSFESFTKITPGFGVFIAVGSIFFAYDGFYVTAGMQSEMKEPKKTPIAILLGLIVVTVIYLLIALSMSLGSTNGSIAGFQKFFIDNKLEWLYAAIQIMVGIGVLGIINGFALWGTRFTEDLIKANELPYSVKLVSKLKDNKATVGAIYSLVTFIPIAIVFCSIGGLAYINSSYKPEGYGYGSGVGELYSFADLMGTWTSVIAFTFILIVIIGAIKNRKTNKIKVTKNKLFLPTAIAATILMALPIFMTFVGPIADCFILFKVVNDKVVNDPNEFIVDYLVPRIMMVIVLIIILVLMLIPTILETHLLKTKYGSVQKGEIEKIRQMAIALNVSFEEKLIETIKTQKRNELNELEKQILKVNKLDELKL